MKDSQRKAMFAKLQYGRYDKHGMYSKNVKLPNGYSPSIEKQREGFVIIGTWNKPVPKDDKVFFSQIKNEQLKFKRKEIKMPIDATRARLIVGKRVVSRAS